MKRRFLNVGLIATLAFGMTFTMYSCSDNASDEDSSSDTEQQDEKDEEPEKDPEPVSEIGNWTQEEKDKANRVVETLKTSLEASLGDKAQAYIDCYLEKVENNYPNFASADSDQAGCTALANECANEIMQ